MTQSVETERIKIWFVFYFLETNALYFKAFLLFLAQFQLDSFVVLCLRFLCHLSFSSFSGNLRNEFIPKCHFSCSVTLLQPRFHVEGQVELLVFCERLPRDRWRVGARRSWRSGNKTYKMRCLQFCITGGARLQPNGKRVGLRINWSSAEGGYILSCLTLTLPLFTQKYKWTRWAFRTPNKTSNGKYRIVSDKKQKQSKNTLTWVKTFSSLSQVCLISSGSRESYIRWDKLIFYIQTVIILQVNYACEARCPKYGVPCIPGYFPGSLFCVLGPDTSVALKLPLFIQDYKWDEGPAIFTNSRRWETLLTQIWQSLSKASWYTCWIPSQFRKI